MFLNFSSIKTINLFTRRFHLGKHFKSPNPQHILFNSICVNLRQKKWHFIDQISPSNLTNSLLNRVVYEFHMSPDLVLGFYKRIEQQKTFLPSLQCVCMLIHVMINCKRYDNALDLMKKLMRNSGHSHFELLEGLWRGFEVGFSSPVVFDALVRACNELGNAECSYEVIQKLELENGFRVSIHAWNNYLNRLLKCDEIDLFRERYKEMISYGYSENIYTLNLVVYALCKEKHLHEAMSVFYRMLKGGVYPNVVTFNMIIDRVCKTGDVETGLKLFRKIGTMSMGFVTPNLVTFNCLTNGYCKLGDMKIAKSLFDEMTKMGIEPNVRTYATLVDGYLRNGAMDEAFRLCAHMVETRRI